MKTICKGCQAIDTELQDNYCAICIWDNMPKYEKPYPKQEENENH